MTSSRSPVQGLAVWFALMRMALPCMYQFRMLAHALAALLCGRRVVLVVLDPCVTLCVAVSLTAMCCFETQASDCT